MLTAVLPHLENHGHSSTPAVALFESADGRSMYELVSRGLTDVYFADPTAADDSFELRSKIHGSDLVVVLAQSRDTQRMVNRFAVAASRPVLYVLRHDNDFGGSLFWVLPRASQLANRWGATPCWNCVQRALPQPSSARHLVPLHSLEILTLHFIVEILAPNPKLAAPLLRRRPSIFPDYSLPSKFDPECDVCSPTAASV